MLLKRIHQFSCFVIIAILLAGCSADIQNTSQNSKGNQTTAVSTTPKSEEVDVILYYPTNDALYLVPVSMKVVKEEKWLENGIKLLSENPKDEKLTKSFPVADMIKSIRIENETAYVDMNGDALKKVSRASTTEQIVIQSIVYTLVKNTNVKQVVFYVDGKNKETLLGHIDIIDPVQPDPNWIKK